MSFYIIGSRINRLYSIQYIKAFNRKNSEITQKEVKQEREKQEKGLFFKWWSITLLFLSSFSNNTLTKKTLIVHFKVGSLFLSLSLSLFSLLFCVIHHPLMWMFLCYCQIICTLCHCPCLFYFSVTDASIVIGFPTPTLFACPNAFNVLDETGNTEQGE